MRNEIIIDAKLVKNLIDEQFPQWSQLPMRAVKVSGWDNRTFHLGDEMLVRMPSSEDYAWQVEKEQKWLPKLAPHLPLKIPVPLAMGMPSQDYPWNWSIYRWLPGETAAIDPINNLENFAKQLAEFLNTLRRIDTAGGPVAGFHSFYRGGSLKMYDQETRRAIETLKNKIDTKLATTIWETALQSEWQNAPAWVHGDMSAGNLLVQHGQLSAVIDFGQLAVGDPACDLVVAWTLFKNESRMIFRNTINLDKSTWERACGWVLWKNLIVLAKISNPNNTESKKANEIIKDIFTDY